MYPLGKGVDELCVDQDAVGFILPVSNAGENLFLL
jgi:hypothetical protein